MEIKPKAWGWTMPLFNKNNVEVHRISVKKGGYCSRHIHRSKANKFIVTKGRLKISLTSVYEKHSEEDHVILNEGMQLTVPPGVMHMFEAMEDTEALEIYWVELDENDIVRHSAGGIKDYGTDAMQTESDYPSATAIRRGWAGEFVGR